MFHWVLKQAFDEHEVSVRWVDSTRKIEFEVDRAIEAAWQKMTAQCGAKLFDGPVARCESIQATSNQLLISLSRTSYKIVVGTNFMNPEFAERFGAEVMANPIGVSAAIISADRRLILGRRNATVAYYPNRVHPFAGSLEPREELNLFDEVRREMREEIGLTAHDFESIKLTGIVVDNILKHPEVIFLARSRLICEKIIERIDPVEHRGAWHCSVDQQPVDLEELTPVARAVVDALVSRPETR